MTRAKTLQDFLTLLKAELRLNNLQLAKRIDVSSKIILAIDEKKIDIDDLELGVYKELIELKNWNKNYLYEPFIPKSYSKNLIKGFADFVKKLMAEKQLNLQNIAELQEEITIDFINQIVNKEIHPDRVNILFIKKLLIQAKKLTEKRIHKYYYRPIVESIFTTYEITRFSELVYDLRDRILQINQKTFGEQIGVSGANISRWETGQTNPDSIKVEHFRSLANLKGWTVEHLLNYIYGQENQQESYESVAAKAKKLPTLLRLKLAKELLALDEKDLTFHSLESFSQKLKDYINQQNLSLEEASKKLRIKPVSRLDSLLNQQELPTNMELLKLASLPDFFDEEGDRYSYEELKQMIYGRFTIENPEQGRQS